MSLELIYNFLLKREAFLMRKGGKSKKSKKGIHIDPNNEGKFTEQASRAGMGVQEYARHVLANKENYDATTVRRANFARNFGGASHKKANSHSLGGRLSAYLQPGGYVPDTTYSAIVKSKENRFDKYIDKNMQKRYFGSPVALRASGGSFGFLGDIPPDTQETAGYSFLTGSQAYDKFGTDTSIFNSALADAFITDQTGAATYDFRHYTPLFRNRFGIYGNNLNTIDRMFAEAGFGLPQRAALMASIIHESKGNPSNVDKGKEFRGLIQWSKDRFPDFDDHKNDLEYQVKKIIDEIMYMPRGSWTDGAAGGTVVNHANEGRWNFMSAKTPEDAAFYLNKCYIRPYSSDKLKDNTANRLAAYDNRSKEARNIFDLYNSQLQI